MKIQKSNSSRELCPIDSDFSGGFMHAIHQFYCTIHKHLEQTLTSKKQISFSQFMILIGFSSKEYLYITQSKLADHLMLTEATVSRHISTLVTKKLLTKEKDPDNKRSYKLSLTPRGITVYLEAKKIIMEELDTYLSSIKETDREIIIKNFIRITETLNEKK